MDVFTTQASLAKINQLNQTSDTDSGYTDTEQKIQAYFQSLNTENFQAAAKLFHSTGVLHPPFGHAVVGQAAIADYLKRESKGMKLTPHQYQTQVLETGDRECEVKGTVQTSLFTVNIVWFFTFNCRAELSTVKVKLLASLQELLSLRQIEAI